MDLYFKHFHLHPVEIQQRQNYIYKNKFPQTMIPPTLNFSKEVVIKKYNFDVFVNSVKERKRIKLANKKEIYLFLNSV